MKVIETRSPSDIPLRIRNDAAAWIMELHASARSPSVDAALREWLAQSASHREAFEIASDMWNSASTLPVSTVGRIARSGRNDPVMWRRPWLAAAACAALALVAGIIYRSQDRSLTTVVGEQRTLTLEDGTRVTLNTATRLTISIDERMRRIGLEAGEALFEVAQNPHRPFVVAVADREVTALGTSFIVRHDGSRTAITLMEGKVSVAPRNSRTVEAAESPPATTMLRPGERLTLVERMHPRLDRPSIESVTAWKRGQAAFQNTPLSEAIDEMNRYSERKLVLADAEAAAVRVSGIFRVGESETFALALSSTYPLTFDEQGNFLFIHGARQRDP